MSRSLESSIEIELIESLGLNARYCTTIRDGCDQQPQNPKFIDSDEDSFFSVDFNVEERDKPDRAFQILEDTEIDVIEEGEVGMDDICVTGRALKDKFDRLQEEGGAYLRRMNEKVEGRLSRLSATAFCGSLVIPQRMKESNEEQELRAFQNFRKNAAASICSICSEERPNIVTLDGGKVVHITCMTDAYRRKRSVHPMFNIFTSSLVYHHSDGIRAFNKFRKNTAADTCSICFEEKPDMATLCCGKLVHIKCMRRWLRRTKSCHQCRGDMSRNPTIQLSPSFCSR